MQIAEDTSTLRNAAGRCAAAAVLTFALALGSMGAFPVPALAETEGTLSTFVDEKAAPEVITVHSVQFTKTSKNTVLVSLTQATKDSAVSVELGALDKNGQQLDGCTFAFTDAAKALPTCHDIKRGLNWDLVVSNGIRPISADADVFDLGTLTVPEGTAKAAVHALVSIEGTAGERIPATTADNLGELVMDAALVPSDPDDPGSTDDPTNTDKPGNTDEPGNTDKPGNTTDPGNISDPGNVQNPGGSGGGTTDDGNGSQGSSNNGTKNNYVVKSNTKKLPQTGDGQVIDASAMLFIAGGAALAAVAVLFFRKRRQQ